MSVYEFVVNANTPGADKIEKLGTDIDKLADYTDRIAAAQRAWLLENDKLIKSQATLAGAEAQRKALIEQFEEAQRKRFESEERGWRGIQAAQDAANKQNEKYASDTEKNAERIRKAQEAAAAAAQKSNEQLGASVKNFIQNPLGAAGDAAEKFILQYGAIGVAALGAASGLAIVGGWLISNASAAAKYAQDVSNLASRTGMTTTETQLYSRASEVAGINAGTLTTAMRTLSRGMSENSDEGKKQKQVLLELGIGSDAAFKPMGQLLPEIFEKLSQVGNAMERDRMTIALFGRGGLEMEPLFAHFQELEDRVTATGIVLSKDGIDKLKAYQEQMTLLGMKWDAIKLKLAEPTIGFIEVIAMMHGINLNGDSGVPAHATGQEVLDQRREQRRIQLHADFAEGNASALDSYNASIRPKDPLKKLAADRESEQNKVLGATDIPSRQSALEKLAATDAQIKAIKDQTEALKKAATETEHLTGEQKRAREAFAKSMQDGEPTPQRKYNDAMIGAFANNRSEQAGAITPGYCQEVSANSQLDFKTAFNNFISDLAKEADKLAKEAERLRTEGEKIGEESLTRSAKLGEETGKEALKNAAEMLNVSPIFASSIVQPPGVTPQRQLQEAHSQNAADLRSLGARSRTAGVDDPDATYDVRMNNMARELAAELRIADLKKTDAEKEEARLDALDKAKELYYQAEEDRQEALAAAVEAQADAFAKGMTGLLAAGRAKGGIGVQNYFKSYAEQMEDTVVGNAAKAAWTGGIGKVANQFKATDSDSWFGKLAKGTPFGANPAATETKSNTDATVDNTKATQLVADALSKYLQTVPGSPTYNPTAQAAAVQQYGVALGVGSPTSPGGSSYMAPGLINSVITDSGTGSSPINTPISPLASLTGDSTMVSNAVQRVMQGSTSPSDMAIFKSVAGAVGGVGKLITAVTAPSGSDSSYTTSPLIAQYAAQTYPGDYTPSPLIAGYASQTYASAMDGNPAVTIGADGLPNNSDMSLPQMASISRPGTSNVGSEIAGAAGLGMSAFGIYSGLHAGGVQGDLTAAASAVGAVASVMTMISPALSAIPILGAIAPMIGMVASMFGTGPQVREKAITQDLKYNQFMAPVALNESMSTNGTYLDSNQFGGVRTSSLSPNEVVQQGYYDYKHNTTVPGQVVSSFSYGNTANGASAAAPPTVITNNISAMDGTDVERVLTKHIGVVGDVLNRGLQTGATGTGLQDTISRL